MCGRYVLAVDPGQLRQAFDLTTVPDFGPRFNIAPTQSLPVIPNNRADQAEMFRWGLIPSWAKDPKIGNTLINARADGVAEKPSFRAAFKRRRCLVPSTGFYEWHATDDGKVPMFIHLPERPVFALAGLWESWKEPESDEWINTYTIITTDANDFMKNIHTRMPVILHPEDHALWLKDEDVPADVLRPLLRPYESDAMAAYEVSKAVNRPANDVPDLLEPVA